MDQPCEPEELTLALYAPPLPLSTYGEPGSAEFVLSTAFTSYVSGQVPVVDHDSARSSDILPLFCRIVPVVLKLVAPATFKPPRVQVGAPAVVAVDCFPDT